MTNEFSNEMDKIQKSVRFASRVEMVRRLALMIGIIGAVLCSTWTNFQPYLAVNKLPARELEQVEILVKHQTLIPGRSLEQSESPFSFDPDSVVFVHGQVWHNWFQVVQIALTEAEVHDSWKYRLTADDIKDIDRCDKGKTSFQPSIGRLLFWPHEVPLKEVFSDKKPGEKFILALDENNPTQFLSVYYSKAPELCGLGGSLYGIPDAFAYPLRKFWWLPLLSALLVYIVLPRPARPINVCSYPQWQVVLADLASVILFGTFAALPFFIVGGFVQALTTWILFSAIFFAFAAAGLLCLWWSNFFAVYRVYVLGDGLVHVSPQGVIPVRYSDIKEIENVRLVSPRWLVGVTSLAAIFGKGSSGLGAAGRAALLASSAMDGLRIGTKDNKTVYIWATNSMAQISLSNWECLLSALKKTDARQLPDKRQIESIFPPIVENTQVLV